MSAQQTLPCRCGRCGSAAGAQRLVAPPTSGLGDVSWLLPPSGWWLRLPVQAGAQELAAQCAACGAPAGGHP